MSQTNAFQTQQTQQEQVGYAGLFTGSQPPSTSEIPDGDWGFWDDTQGVVRLVRNHGGTILGVQIS